MVTQSQQQTVFVTLTPSIILTMVALLYKFVFFDGNLSVPML